MATAFQPTTSLNKAIFNACDALAVMAGTTRPIYGVDAIWQIEKKGCAAIVALGLAGVPNDAVIAALAVRMTAAELAIVQALADASAAQAAAVAAQATADAALILATTASAIDVFTAVNKDASAVVPGIAVAPHPSGTGTLLAVNTVPSRYANGLARTGAASNFAFDFMIGDKLTLSDWSAVTGAVTLSPLAIYFLASTPGLISLTAPTALGSIVQIVGFSLSPNTLRILINPPILL